MNVFFVDERLATLLQSDKQLRREFGKDNAKWIPKRLENLRFAANLAEMYTLPGGFHPLVGDRAGSFAINLKHGYRMILVPADEPIPRTSDGGLDLKAIVTVMVIDVENYHDG